MSVGEVCISVIDMSILASMIIVIVLVLRLLFKRAPGWNSGAALGYCCIAVNYSDDDRKSAEPCSEQLSYRNFQRKTLC